MFPSDINRVVAMLLPAVWLGAVLSISFLEAPLKFRAPGVTREAALSIGRLVFRALGRIELGIWCLEGLLLWTAGWPGRALLWFGALAAILALQQAWWRPRLESHAAAILRGEAVAPTRGLHQFYIGGECAKVLLLPALSLSLTAV